MPHNDSLSSRGRCRTCELRKTVMRPRSAEATCYAAHSLDRYHGMCFALPMTEHISMHSACAHALTKHPNPHSYCTSSVTATRTKFKVDFPQTGQSSDSRRPKSANSGGSAEIVTEVTFPNDDAG